MRLSGILFAIVSLVPIMHAKQEGPPRATSEAVFEVASVRQNTSGDRQLSYRVLPGGRFVATNVPLRDLIGYAYGLDRSLQRYLIIGGPGETMSARFDINARQPERVATGQELPMLRALLAERFKLRTRTETRQIPVYALAVVRDGRLGPELRPSGHNCTVWRDARRAAAASGGDVPEPRDTNGKPLCTANPFAGAPTGAYVSRRAGTMVDLIGELQANVDRPIVDMTGLAGNFEWTLTFSLLPSDRISAVPPTGLDLQAPLVFAALPEQLGLRLEPRNAPHEVLVVDSVGMPTPD
jgi:uncharacterized protein (TIGR03435 family)